MQWVERDVPIALGFVGGQATNKPDGDIGLHLGEEQGRTVVTVVPTAIGRYGDWDDRRYLKPSPTLRRDVVDTPA